MTSVGGFEIVRSLGRGAGGRVYLARDAALGRLVAVKVLAPEHALVPEAVERFRREAQALAALEHASVVRVHQVGTDSDGRHYCVQEYVPGDDLEALLAREPVSIERAARLVAAVARGLEAAHLRGILHRDVKPANVVVAPDDRAVLVDFGLARLEGEAAITGAEAFGTPAYMAPELLERGAREATPASDTFSLGAVLFEALTLTRPFPEGGTRPAEAPPVRRLRPSVPPELEAIVAVALDPDPARRYSEAGALARDLEAFLDRRPVSARRAGVLGRLASRARRRPGAALAVAGLAGLALALVAREASRVAGERERRREVEARIARARAGRLAEGLADLERLLDLDPGDAAARSARDELRERVPAALEAELTRGEAALARDDLARALEAAERALELAPVDSRAVALRGRALAGVGAVPLRFVVAGTPSEVSVREPGGWRSLGPAPAATRVRPGVLVVRVRAPSRHELQLPVRVERPPALVEGTAVDVPLPEPPPLEPRTEGMRLVPAGEFVVGGPALNATPAAPTRVAGAAFWIDRCEVTAGELAAFEASGGYERRELWSEEGWRWRLEHGVRGPPASEAGPGAAASGLSRHEAEAFARARGMRLPTAEEWERAARGIDGRAYPWGDEDPPWGLAPPRLPRAPGSEPLDESPYGVLDLGGNVAEWTSSVLVLAGREDPARAIVKGGGVGFRAELGLSRAAARATLDPGDRAHGIGVRCAVSP